MTTPDTTTTEGKIAVMQARESGKIVEWRCLTNPTDIWTPYYHDSWRWGEFEFRIAPEPPKKIVEPWTFETAPTHRLRLRRKADGRLACTAVYPDGLVVGFTRITSFENLSVSWQDLADEWEQLDGSPCGTWKEVQA